MGNKKYNEYLWFPLSAVIKDKEEISILPFEIKM